MSRNGVSKSTSFFLFMSNISSLDSIMRYALYFARKKTMEIPRRISSISENVETSLPPPFIMGA